MFLSAGLLGLPTAMSQPAGAAAAATSAAPDAAREQPGARADRKRRRGAREPAASQPQQQAPATGAAPVGPRKAIEIFGIELGVTPFDVAEAKMKQRQPPMKVEYAVAALGYKGVELGGTRHATQFAASNDAPAGSPCGEAIPSSTGALPPRPGHICDRLAVAFARPPSKPLAVLIDRTAMLGDLVGLNKARESLVAQFGEPGSQRRSKIALELAWAWDASGRPTPLDERHRCSVSASSFGGWRGVGDARRPSETETRMQALVQAGCATLLRVTLHTPMGEDAVRVMRYVALDAQGAWQSEQKTRQYVGEAAARMEGARAQSIDARPVPKP